MSDDQHEKPDLDYYADFQDPIAQRAVAFCNLAQVAESVSTPEIRELCLSMMQKLCATVRTPPKAELKAISTAPAAE